MKNTLKIFTMLFLVHTLLFSDQIDKSLNVIEKTNIKLENFQTKINKEDESKNILLNEYKYTNKELQNTIKYNQDANSEIKTNLAPFPSEFVHLLSKWFLHKPQV